EQVECNEHKFGFSVEH
ncbi:hypothetical protein RvY_19455, partial [Ramazzottius varieornatus]